MDKQEQSDEEVSAVIRAACEGDEQSVAQVLTLFGDDVKAACRHFSLLRSSELSHSDFLQEAWLRIWSRLSSFKGSNDATDTVRMFHAWIRTTSRNVVLNVLTKSNREDSVRRHIANNCERPPTDDSPSEIYRGKELNQQLRLQISELPEEQRALIDHCFTDGLSLKEAARREGITYDQARSRMSKAMEALQRYFDDSTP